VQIDKRRSSVGYQTTSDKISRAAFDWKWRKQVEQGQTEPEFTGRTELLEPRQKMLESRVKLSVGSVTLAK